MPSRLPPRIQVSPRQPDLGRLVRPINSANPIASTPTGVTETFRKRRGGIWAVGIAIIAGAGALLGAQLKEGRQAKERVTTWEQNLAVSSGTEEVSERSEAGEKKMLRREPEQATSKAPQAVVDTAIIKDEDIYASGRGSSYDRRQIMYLEDRRGELMKQKFDLERKLERVREKKSREAQIQQGRKLETGTDK